jgi:hypothetical protein
VEQVAAQNEERLLDAAERRVARMAMRPDSYAEVLLCSDGRPQPHPVVQFPEEFSGIAC